MLVKMMTSMAGAKLSHHYGEEVDSLDAGTVGRLCCGEQAIPLDDEAKDAMADEQDRRDKAAAKEDKATAKEAAPKKDAGPKLTIAEAIAKLDTTKDGDFTNGGKPNAYALGELMGEDVSGKDRDAAWKVHPSNPDNAE